MRGFIFWFSLLLLQDLWQHVVDIVFESILLCFWYQNLSQNAFKNRSKKSSIFASIFYRFLTDFDPHLGSHFPPKSNKRGARLLGGPPIFSNLVFCCLWKAPLALIFLDFPTPGDGFLMIFSSFWDPSCYICSSICIFFVFVFLFLSLLFSSIPSTSPRFPTHSRPFSTLSPSLSSSFFQHFSNTFLYRFWLHPGSQDGSQIHQKSTKK